MNKNESEHFQASRVHPRLLSHPSAIGILDWTTGLIALNADKDDYSKMLRWSAAPDSTRGVPTTKNGISFRFLMEAVIHEFIHCLQVNLCGYPFKLAADLWSGFANDIENFDRALTSLTSRADGVTAVDVMESAAFLAQKRSVHPKISTPAYRRVLADNMPPGSPYRVAFDRTYSIWEGTALEDVAIDAFQLIANVALCSHSPGEALVRLADSSAKKTSMNTFKKLVVGNYAIGKKFDYLHWNRVIKESIEELDLKMLGDSTEVLHRSEPKPYHPVFARTLWRVANLGVRHKGLLLKLHAHPHQWTPEVFAHACPPIVLKSARGITEASIVSHYRNQMPGDISDDALFQGLLGTVHLNEILRKQLKSQGSVLMLNETIDLSSPVVRSTESYRLSMTDLTSVANMLER